MCQNHYSSLLPSKTLSTRQGTPNLRCPFYWVQSISLKYESFTSQRFSSSLMRLLFSAFSFFRRRISALSFFLPNKPIVMSPFLTLSTLVCNYFSINSNIKHLKSKDCNAPVTSVFSRYLLLIFRFSIILFPSPARRILSHRQGRLL